MQLQVRLLTTANIASFTHKALKIKNKQMKRTLLSLLFALGLGSVSAQIQVAFSENFDGPPPFGTTTYNTLAANPVLFAPTSTLAFTSPNSMFTQWVNNDTIYLETAPFTTVGSAFVRLTFNHICKIFIQQRARVQYSTDNGVTWSNLGAAQYQGTSANFIQVGYFNESSYQPLWGGISTGGTTPPTNNWWVQETFDVTNVLVGPGGSGPGFPQCKIRFALQHGASFPINPAGWFIDDILIEKSDCELEAPFVSFGHGTAVPLQPIGARYQPTEKVRFGAWDNIAIAVNRLTYRINNGPWIDTSLTNLGPQPPDTTLFEFEWQNISLGDTIDWYLTVEDTCDNVTRRPLAIASPNYYSFWRAPAPPARCGLTTPNSFPFIISTLPWFEPFEDPHWVPGTGSGAGGGTTHRGSMPLGNPPQGRNWVAAPNLNQPGFGWSVRGGATATANTGPSANHTPSGSKFVYADASQSQPGQARLITPCIDIPSTGCFALEFYFHMFGADINRLRIDIDTGAANNDNESFAIGYSAIIGQQQTASTQPWQRAFIPLEGLNGKTIKIRFFAVRTANNGPLADIAIDDLRIYEPPTTDLALTNIFTPEDGFCSYSAQTPVQVRVQNVGCAIQPNFPIAFSVNGTIFRDTIQGPFASGDDTVYTFTPTANLSAYNTFNISAWSEGSGDTENQNDTVSGLTINHPSPYNTFPLLETFDGPGWTPGNTGTPITGGTFNTTNGWTPVPAAGAVHQFRVGTFLSPSNATGPRNDYRGGGNYIYATGALGNAPGNGTYESQCLDLIGMANPVLEFAYHMHGQNVGQLRVEVIPPGSKDWVQLPGAILNGQQQTQVVQQWRFASYPLTQYANEVIRLRIVASKTGAGSAADISIDDLRIYNRIPQDAGIIDVQFPSYGIETFSTTPITVVIRNFGSQPLTSVPVTVTLTPECGPNANVPVTVNGTWTGNLAPTAQAAFQLNVPASGYPLGTFEICGTTNVTGDNLAFNNEYCKKSAGFDTINITNGYFDNFDPCGGDRFGYFPGGSPTGPPSLRLFEIGTPPGGAASAPNAWTTDQFARLRPNTQEILRIPPVVGFDTIRGAEFRFRQKFNFGSTDGAVLERLNPGGNWATFGGPGLGNNWYGDPDIGSPNAPQVNTPGWAGSTANNWVLSTYPMGALDFSPATVNFRFRVQTGATSNGSFWNIDDVEIFIPPQNSAAAIDIEPLGYFWVPDVTNQVRIRIQNTGAKPLDSVNVSYSTNGGATYTPEQLLVFSPPLPRNARSQWIIMDQPWVNPPSGGVTLCLATSKPNGKNDNFTPDDTLCVPDVVLDKVIIDENNGYCNDFDDPSINPWIAYNAFVKSGNYSWEFGVPNQAPINPRPGSPNAWMTDLNNDYLVRDSSALFTPVFEIQENVTYKMSFEHNFITELYHDGGCVDVSFDGGSNWFKVGWPNLPNWYNTPFVTALDIVKSGWSGNSNGWIPAELNIAFPFTASALFRFRFGADFTLEYQGWAIDDFCFEVTNEPADDLISVDDVDEPFFGIGNVMPTPATDFAQVPFKLRERSDIQVTITNLLGQVVYEGAESFSEGINAFRFDVSAYQSGTYFMTFTVNGQQEVRRLVISR